MRVKILLVCALCFLRFGFLEAKIAVVTIAQGEEYKNRVELGMKSKEEYCQRHGYDFILKDQSEDTSRHIYWSKIPLMRKVLEHPSYDWVVWIDADTLMMNMEIPLEIFLDDNYNFIISRDWQAINSGVFFVKNCQWSKDFLDRVYNRVDCVDHFLPDQEAISRELKNNNEIDAMAKIVPQRLFNSYCSEILGYHTDLTTLYQKGDFLLHFASADALYSNLLKDWMEKYYPLRIDDPSLFFNLDHFLGIYGYQLSPLDSEKNEGYMSEAQAKEFKKRLKENPQIQSVLEVGLNAGHSAENFFEECENLKKFVSFDLNEHSYTQVAVQYFQMKYGDRFDFIEGPSQETIPAYAQTFPEEKFDLIYIDGAHSYAGALNDIINCAGLAHEDTILLIDDYWWGGTVTQAVDVLCHQGLIEIVERIVVRDDSGWRVWVEARYH